MSLNFNEAGSGRRSNHGFSSSLNGLPANGFTLWGWATRRASGTNQELLTKDLVIGSDAGWLVVCQNYLANGEGSLQFLVWRATRTEFISNPGVFAADIPTFWACVFDDAASPKMRLYSGTLQSPVNEVPSYLLTSAGSGAFTADGTCSVWAGNVERTAVNPFLGEIPRNGIIGRPVALAELQQIQFAPFEEQRVPGTRLLVDYQGTGPQIDISGYGNHGVVVLATPAVHPPLPVVRRRHVLSWRSAYRELIPSAGGLTLAGLAGAMNYQVNMPDEL